MVDGVVRSPGTPTTGYTDPDRTARVITGKSDLAVSDWPVELRQGVVTAVDVPNARVDVALGGDSTAIPAVAHLSNYRPTVNDPCWVLVNGPDLLVLDRLGPFGPSVISGAQSAIVYTSQSRSSSSYGDLATPGPSVTAVVSPSGRLLVQTSAWIYQEHTADADENGGAMAFALTGANTRSPFDVECSVWFHAAGGVLGTDNISSMTASKVTLLTGLNPGSTTVTAKYRTVSASGLAGVFEDRTVWVMPL